MDILAITEWIDSQFDVSQDILETYPLMYPSQMIGMMAAYVIMVFTLPVAMQIRKEPFTLRWVGFVWNIMMSLLSGYMFIGTASTLYENMMREPNVPALLMCDPEASLSRNMEYWTYLFYLSKFVEYIDTVFLILRKKQVIFLHWYHHMVTCTIVWTSWLYQVPADQWIGPLTNTFVHIFMYAYFALTEVGLSRKWGKYITMVQLAQFYLCVAAFVIVGTGFLLGHCNGHGQTFIWLMLQYVMFLFLFMRLDKQRKAALAKKQKEKSKNKSD